jgi:hypothetical protein
LLVRRGAIYTGDVLVEVGGSGYAPDEVHARTMAFTTLTMYQLFHAYNCRSKRGSVFSGFFGNKWLLVAIVFSLGAHFLVIYDPFLQTAFHTVGLSAFDWLVATSVSASLLFAWSWRSCCLTGSTLSVGSMKNGSVSGNTVPNFAPAVTMMRAQQRLSCASASLRSKARPTAPTQIAELSNLINESVG